MLKYIEVTGLFGRFDYRIRLKDEGITVLTGPNGFGKSTVFALIEAAAGINRDVFYRIPFKSFTLDCGTDGNFVWTKSGEIISLDGETIDGGTEKEKTAANALGAVRTVNCRRFFDSALTDEYRLKEYIAAIKTIPERLKSELNKNFAVNKIKLELFTRLLTDKLAFKKPEVDGERGIVFKDVSGDYLQFTDLSAGEIQLTAFYYELLFESPVGALLLIDEPEISMHVVWQFGLIDDLTEICSALGGAKAVVATHSPQVLGGHRELQVDLGEQYER